MPIADLVYNLDVARKPDGCGCGSSSTANTPSSSADTTTCNCSNGAIAYFIPPPYVDVTKYPYPPVPYCPPAPPEEMVVRQSATEKTICKLSKKASAIRQLIENLEEKNKPLIVKSGAASYNLGSYKTVDPDDSTLTIEDEHIESVIDILKAELETIKEEIKEASDKLTDD